MNYSYIIVEDNEECTNLLQSILKDYPNYSCLGVATSVSGGISLALKTRPALIFLDVQLGSKTGFELIAELRLHFHKMPSIIVTTDYDKYAKQAVNNDVLYFLDKPYDLDEMTIAITKFERKYAELYSSLFIKSEQGNWSLDYSDIFYIQARGNMIDIWTINSINPKLFSKTLKDIEKTLPVQFLRVHNSYIVNIQYVEKWNTTVMKLWLKAHTGQIESVLVEKIGIDTKLQYKDHEKEIPLGEKYLEKVKNSLGILGTI